MNNNLFKELINHNVIHNIKQSIDCKDDVTVEITVTNACNCRCKYCFEQNSNNFNVPIDAIEQQHQLRLLVELCENFDPIKYNRIHIVFWGGEPMCNFEFIEKIISKTYKYDFVDYFMYTNGTLYDEFIKFVSSKIIYDCRQRIVLQFSYDGEPHHTLMRGNTSHQLLKTVRLVKENGFLVKFKATLTFDMVQYFPQCWKSYEQLYNEFGDIVEYCPTLDTMQTSISNNMFNVWKKVVDEVIKYEFRFISLNKHPLLTWLFNNKHNKAICNLNNHIMVATDGNIYICHGCQYSNHKDSFKLGNTKDISSFYQVIKNIFPLSSFQLSAECEKCGAIFCNICHIAQVNNNDYVDNWSKCRCNNKLRCEFFKYFGKAFNALQLALIENNYGIMPNI